MVDGGGAVGAVPAIPIPVFAYKRPPLAKYQVDAIFTQKRYGLIEASTKAGKTAGCLVWLLEQALRGKENWNYWWVAPVYSQAKIAYRRMKRGIPRNMYKANETELTITLRGGMVIWFKTAEKPDNLYGEDVHAAVVDEATRCKEESWHAIRSTLTATRGPIRIIGNVKGRKNWAYKLARKAEAGHKDMSFARITAKHAILAGIITQEEVDDARATLPESVFNELYMAIPSEADGRVYSSFQFAYNVSDSIKDVGGVVHVGMDFNVNPMTATLGSVVGNELHEWGEVYQPNSNTERMGNTLRKILGDNRDVIIYPDPSGNSRRTNANLGQTDHAILRKFGFEVVAPPAAPPVIDRVNEVNAMLCTSNGTRRTFINPTGCPHLIEAFDGLIWSEKGTGIDKTMGLDHITDAHGYKVHCIFPLPTGVVSTQSFRR